MCRLSYRVRLRLFLLIGVCARVYVARARALQENGLEIEEDPRPYTAAVREFVRDNQPAPAEGEPGLGLADAARLWGRIWRQGVPYSSLLNNSINHPNRDGMGTFVTAILDLFG